MKMLGGGSMPAPKMPDPVRIPNQNDPDVVAGLKAKTQDEFAKRKGRASTNLAAPDLPYSRTTLG